MDEITTLDEWRRVWSRATDAGDSERVRTLLCELIFVTDDSSGVAADSIQKMIQGSGTIGLRTFEILLMHLQESWPELSPPQRAALVDALFGRRTQFYRPYIALLGDWVSDECPLDVAKVRMVQLIREFPDQLGDVLFSMETRLFPRLAASDSVDARQVYDRVYTMKEEPTAEWVARQFEAIWPG